MRRLAMVLAILLAIAPPATALADPAPIRLVINGQEVVTDVPPFIEDGRTLVPVRAITETLGFDVEWDGATQTVTVTKDDQVIILCIGRNTAVVNGRTVPIDVQPKIVNGRTMIPLRLVIENMGLQVAWDDATRTVSVSSPTPPPAEPPAEPTAEPPAEPPAQPPAKPPVEPPAQPPAKPAGTTPAQPVGTTASTHQAWNSLVEQCGEDGLISGTLHIHTEGEDPVTFIKERYLKGDDVLSLTYLEFEGERMLIQGGAKYQGQYWGASMLSGWVPAQEFQDEFGGLPSDAGNTEQAEVTMSPGILDAVPMTKFTVVWDAAAYESGEEGEGTVTVTYWVDQTGRMHRFEIDGEVTLDGLTTTTRGVFTW